MDMPDKGHGGTSTTGPVIERLFTKHLDDMKNLAPSRHQDAVKAIIERVLIMVRLYQSDHKVKHFI